MLQTFRWSWVNFFPPGLFFIFFLLQMLTRLLGLLVLSCLCSAMWVHDDTRAHKGEEEGSTYDPNTYRWDSPPEKGIPSLSPEARRGPLMMPPTGFPFPPFGNNSEGPNMPRMWGGSTPPFPPMPDTTICDMLLNAPVPPPADQIPFFCICKYCKGTVGPKGDRGDRGLPGKPINND